MEYKIPIAGKDYHKSILMILNFSLNLTPMELDIVATVLDYNLSIIDTKAREIIRLKLDKDKFNTNNYIKRLVDKHIFTINPGDKNLYLNESLIGIANNKKVSFEFIINDNNVPS